MANMDMQDFTGPLINRNNSKVILLVLDGLGGLPASEGPDKGKTELEAAYTPHMDNLAKTSACGLHEPVAMGIKPGSGPGHLALFGYDPIRYQIGRGILECLGLGLDVTSRDIALRCNYSTMEGALIKDRRAGRIPTAESAKITARLMKAIKKVNDAEITFSPGMEHRFGVRIRFPETLAEGASALNDTDPQEVGKVPLSPVGETKEADKVVAVVEKLIKLMTDELKDEPVANYPLMRGFSQLPDMPTFEEATGMRPLAVASYPMYRGVAKLVGMEAPALEGDLREEIDFLKDNYEKYDFFFVHVKKVDSYGEDGNFEAKRDKIAEVDKFLPEILQLNPDVLIITGDHSTPAIMSGHSWHPVPVLLKSSYVLGGLCKCFSERQCAGGELGVFPSVSLMPLALANSGRLNKFGA
jgi:2,3-bisphosphoglycerate-independent phosphoglycerate mutase